MLECAIKLLGPLLIVMATLLTSLIIYLYFAYILHEITAEGSISVST